MLEIIYRATNELGYFIPKGEFWLYIGIAFISGFTVLGVSLAIIFTRLKRKEESS